MSGKYIIKSKLISKNRVDLFDVTFKKISLPLLPEFWSSQTARKHDL